MKNKRREPKLAAKIDKADRKERKSKEKENKSKKRSDGDSGGLRPIGEDLSSQYEGAEDEVDRVARGPN